MLVVLSALEKDKKFAEIVAMGVDKNEYLWYNDLIMEQINRKNTGCWWWPAG